jgi:hypothetical protein
MNHSEALAPHPCRLAAALPSALHAIVAIALIAFSVAAVAADPPWAVHCEGRSSDVLTTLSIGPNVPLIDYVHRAHVYGLGPIAGYRGGVLLWDSVLLLGQVESTRAILRTDPNAAAIWFAWSQVTEWSAVTIQNGIRFADLDTLVSGAAATAGVPADAAVPFKVRGRLISAAMTITDYHDDAAPITADKLSNIDDSFELQDQDVELFGFRSIGHKGIFMPSRSNLHVHAHTADSVYHVRDLLLSPGATLFLPVR